MAANAILAAVKIGALGEEIGLLSVAVVKDALLWERGMPLVAEAMPLTGDTVSNPRESEQIAWKDCLCYEESSPN